MGCPCVGRTCGGLVVGSSHVPVQVSKKSRIRKISHLVYLHLVWKKRVEVAININARRIPPEIEQGSGLCPFGKWLQSAERCVHCQSTPHFGDVLALYGKFHQTARQIGTLLVAGERMQARELLTTEYSIASRKLTLAISAWGKAAERDGIHPSCLNTL